MRATGAATIAMMMVLSACTPAEAVRDAPANAGVVQSFDAPYDRVAAATLDALNRLNLPITDLEGKPTGLIIQLAKPQTAFSWGEVGRVIVEHRATPPIPVRVYWEKRSQMQITGTSQRAFATQFYGEIDRQLGRR